MGNKTVMQYDDSQTCYTDEYPSARPSDENFLIKNQLYDEYKEALRKGFVGTYDNYLQCRDWT